MGPMFVSFGIIVINGFSPFIIFAEVGIEAKRFIDKGYLVPDDVMVKLIVAELATFKDSSWLLDGRCWINPSGPERHKYASSNRIDFLMQDLNSSRNLHSDEW